MSHMERIPTRTEPGPSDLDRALLYVIRVRMAEVDIRSQAALAREAGVPEATLRPRWESRRGFGLEMLDGLAGALKLPLSELVARAEAHRAVNAK